MGHRRRRRNAAETAERELVTVRIEEIVAGGAGRGRAPDGRVVFVAFAAPGELVEACVERSHADYLEAVTVRVLERSEERVDAPCPVFGECGGCQLQHLAYPAQLRAKEQVVRTALQRIGHLDPGVVRPMVGARNPWAYRNHVRFSTGKRFGDLGFVRRRGRGLLRIDHCPISDDWVNEVLPQLQGHGRGLHQVQLRHNTEADSRLIAPAIASAPLETGQRWYSERLAGHTFRVSADSFFQVNNAQAEELVRLAGEALPLQGGLLVDAYAGVGTFAVIFAPRFARVIAIEESRTALRDAAENVAAAGNVELVEGKVEAELGKLSARPDCVLLDPPRAGCGAPVLAAITRLGPPVVVYVSCDPATLARDLRVLVDGGYEVERVTPVDMFLQTAHIESVTRLVRGQAGPQ